MHEFGVGVPASPQRAEELYFRSCDIGAAAGCRNLAELIRRARPIDFPAIVPLLEKACAGCNGPACSWLAELYWDGSGVRKSESRASLLYARACDLDDWISCGIWGSNLLDGVGVRQDVAEARTILKRACDQGDGPGCLWLGFSYKEEKYGSPNPAKALTLFRAACDSSSAQGCAIAGGMLTLGTGGTQNLDEAFSFYERGCEGGLGEVCLAAAELLLAQPVTAERDKRAEDFIDRSCALGAEEACARLADSYKTMDDEELQKGELNAWDAAEKAIQSASGLENQVTAYDLMNAANNDRVSFDRLIIVSRLLREWELLLAPLLGDPDAKVRRVALLKMFYWIADESGKSQ